MFIFRIFLEQDKNFCEHIVKIENILKLWRMRQLTLEERITVLESLAISQVIHLSLIVHLSLITKLHNNTIGLHLAKRQKLNIVLFAMDMKREV